MSYSDDEAFMIDDGSVELKYKKQATRLKQVLFVVGLICLCLLAATIHLSLKKDSSSSSPSMNVCTTSDCVMDSAQLLKKLDLDANPCENFYQYACGGWDESNEIPSDSASTSQFSELYDANTVKLRDLLEKNLNNTEYKSPSYYKACMDTSERNSESAQKLRDMLEQLASKSSLEDKLAYLMLVDVSSFISLGVGIDDKNATRNNIFLSQSGLGLPDPDYYKFKTIANNTILKTYRDYITNAAQYANVNINATLVVNMEKKLAEIFVPKDKLRDPVAIYNVYLTSKLDQDYTFLNWGNLLDSVYASIGSNKQVKEVINQTPEYFQRLSTLFQTLSTEEVTSFLQWRLVSRYMSQLDDQAIDLHQQLRQAVYGVTSLPPQWETCVSATDDALGFELGRLFVDKYFTEDAKEKIDAMIESIRSSFLTRLSNVQWMDTPTQNVAKEKALAVEQKIGYPEFIKDNQELKKYYQDVTVSNLHIDNYLSVIRHEVKDNFLDLFKPVNKMRWGMTPPTVNAYYSPSENEIVFPAGILQTPFYSPSMVDSVNFGAAGVVIGHELSHGFDDQGRQYDKDGNLRQWWSEDTVNNFKTRAQCFIDQYSSFEVNGEHVNGVLTLGENIADNGGIHTAFSAFKQWQEANGVEDALPGMSHTPDQLFFIGFAQVWCSKFRPQEAHQRLLTDPHSPANFRVIGAVSNTMDFVNAFSCPVPERDMCRLW
eukprot:m.135210 g.135210  ORF g.135210 m.135210 type:complete len:714 (-) comp9866_c0_seq1:190-2331(-)